MRCPVFAAVIAAVTSACQAPPCTEGEVTLARVARAEGSKCSWFPNEAELCPRLSLELLGPGGASEKTAEIETRIETLHASRVQAGALVRVRVTQGGEVCLDTEALAGPAPTLP